MTAALATVLVVEDEPTIRLAAQRALTRRGYDVIVAADGAEALTVLATRSGEVRVVLTDVAMPGMSGRELVQRIQAEFPGMPIVIMSGSVTDVVQHEGPEVPLFLQKPFSLDALAESIAAALARRA